MEMKIFWFRHSSRNLPLKLSSKRYPSVSLVGCVAGRHHADEPFIQGVARELRAIVREEPVWQMPLQPEVFQHLYHSLPESDNLP